MANGLVAQMVWAHPGPDVADQVNIPYMAFLEHQFDKTANPQLPFSEYPWIKVVEIVALELVTQPVITVDVDVGVYADADDDAVPDVNTVMVAEHLSNQPDLRNDYRVPDAINRLDRQL